MPDLDQTTIEFMTREMIEILSKLGRTGNDWVCVIKLIGVAFTLGKILEWRVDHKKLKAGTARDLLAQNAGIIVNETQQLIHRCTTGAFPNVETVCVVASAIAWICELARPHISFQWECFDALLISFIIRHKERLMLPSNTQVNKNHGNAFTEHRDGPSSHWWWTFGALANKQMQF